MSDRTTQLSMIQLKQSLRELALPADRQLSNYPPWIDVPYEIADNFGNWCGWALGRKDVKLTDEMRSNLSSLDAMLQQMSGPHQAELWTEDALTSRPEWEEVRRRAKHILNLFGWTMDS